LNIKILTSRLFYLTTQSETTIKSMQQSIQTSNTLANSIKKSTDDSFSVLERITQTRHDLMDAMEDTEDTIGFIAERQGNVGDDGMLSEGAKSLFDMLENMGSAAYEVRDGTITDVQKHFVHLFYSLLVACFYSCKL
jgi:hypothetical protein